jgi:hypothetical protein
MGYCGWSLSQSGLAAGVGVLRCTSDGLDQSEGQLSGRRRTDHR